MWLKYSYLQQLVNCNALCNVLHVSMHVCQCVMYDKRFAGGYFLDVKHSADWVIGSAPPEKTYDRLEQQIQTQTQIHKYTNTYNTNTLQIG